MELQGFYGHDADSLSGADGVKPSPFLLHAAANKPTTPTLKFHNHFPPDVATWVKIEKMIQILWLLFFISEQLSIPMKSCRCGLFFLDFIKTKK